MTDEATRDRLYAAYATTHAGVSGGGSEPAFQRDIAPHLPANRSAVILDLGYGQGRLVQHLLDHGYANSRGVDISPEQVELAHKAGIGSVTLGDYRAGFDGATLDAVTATDFFAVSYTHLTLPTNREV